jgi:DNA-binding CsgD family transcriptional regulator
MLTTPNMDEIGRRFVNENWMERNSRGRLAVEKGFVGIGRFASGEELFAAGEQEQDPMTNELFRPYGFGRVAGFITDLPHGDTIIMNVEQYWENGPIDDAALGKLNRLYPHLARGLLLAGRADFERSRTAVETLAALGIPAAAVTSQGRVVVANDGFSAATHLLTTRGGDRLALHDRIADRMTSDALASIRTADGPRSVPVRAEAGGPAVAIVQVVPVRRSAHDVFGGTAAIMVLSETRHSVPDAALVHSLFDLTPAELAVAQAIAAGQSPAQIAQSTGRSLSTIRNQLRSVMSKTGSGRQAELAILMRQLGRPG